MQCSSGKFLSRTLTWSGVVDHVTDGESYRLKIQAQTAAQTYRQLGEAGIYNFTIGE